MSAHQAEAILDFLAKKFTNAELYDEMSRILEGIFSFFLKHATALARLVVDQLAFERQETIPTFIQADYRNALNESDTSAGSGVQGSDRGGITGSARLLQDINPLDLYA